MKKLIIFMLLVLPVLCFSQQKKDEERQIITLCWGSDYDSTASYIVYYNRYNTTDTAWRVIGTTNKTTFSINKQTLKGDVAFGVKAVYYNDTSALHTSLDATACSNPGTDCDENCTTGPWYISWHIKKPVRIGIQ